LLRIAVEVEAGGGGVVLWMLSWVVALKEEGLPCLWALVGDETWLF